MKFAFKIIRLPVALGLLAVLRGHLLEPEMSAKTWRDLNEFVELGERVKAGSELLVYNVR